MVHNLPSFFSIVFCSLNAYPKLYRAYYCLQMMSVTAYLSDLKNVPLTTLAEARAERQMAEVEERQRKLADLAESCADRGESQSARSPYFITLLLVA